jgi:Uma2 family endonuclease
LVKRKEAALCAASFLFSFGLKCLRHLGFAMGVSMVAIAELTIISETSTQTTDIASETIWRLSVSQYHTMLQAGIIDEDTQIELLEGILVSKMAKNPPHRISTKLIRQALEHITPEGWYVDSQEPITLVNSEPEPDVVIIRGQTTDYRDRHPADSDVVLVIEVSDATLERDRTIKQRIYARAGIAIYWILNLRDRQLEVFTQPISETESQPKYQQCQIFKETESMSVRWQDGDCDREFGNITVQNLL